MEIDIRLKKILQNAGLDTRGVTQRIADDLGVHRHTIGKLYRNQLSNPSLRVIGQLCDWLRIHGVTEKLPQALFGVRPTALWEAVAELGKVTFYVGEYEEWVEVGPARRWVAPRDIEAWAQIVATLTGHADVGQALPQLRPAYVRFRCEVTGSGLRPGKEVVEEDRQHAARIFKAVSEEPTCSIIIGSQRVNYLLEHVVANLFGAQPFSPVARDAEQRVPFYLHYHDSGRPVESCFGGQRRVPGWKGRAEAGTYWRNERGEWQSFPWKHHEQDAGLVIVIYYPGTKALHLAVFGYSGRGTALVAKKLCRDPTQFWEPQAKGSGRQVGVYLCRFTTKKPPAPTRDELAELAANLCDVVPLNRQMLETYLR